MRVDWFDLWIGLSITIFVLLGILGGVDLLNNNATNIKLIGFYATLILLMSKELFWGVGKILESFRFSGVKK